MADVPEEYRRWRMSDYKPEMAQAIAPFLSGEKRTVYLHGWVGTRKTSIAAVILREWRMRDMRSSAGAWGEFVTADKFRRAAMDFTNGQSVLDHWRARPIIVLDDLGANRSTPHIVETLARLVEYRNGRQLPMICTGNLSPAELGRQLDERIASRVASQLVWIWARKTTGERNRNEHKSQIQTCVVAHEDGQIA
jgi:DNA replication protein DnaC